MKKAYPDLMRQPSKFKKQPGNLYIRLPDIENDEENRARLDFLRRLYAFMFTQGIIQNVQIAWVQSNGTVKDVKNTLEENVELQEIKPYTWYNGKIAYDNKKIKKFFKDANMVENVAKYRQNNTKHQYSLNAYIKELEEAQQSMHPKATILRGCLIDLKTASKETDLSDIEFTAALETIKPYSQAAIKLAQESIPDRVKGYLNHICQANDGQLSEKDRERYRLLTEILTGESGINQVLYDYKLLDLGKNKS